MSELPFAKGQALGNDYIVVDAADLDAPPSGPFIRALCDRHRGVGSDGLLVGALSGGGIALRIFNPDGSEAEKSGNGLRIFAAYLHGRGLVGSDPFTVRLPGEEVGMQVLGAAPGGALHIVVDMGRASFLAGDVGFRPEQDAEAQAGTAAYTGEGGRRGGDPRPGGGTRASGDEARGGDVGRGGDARPDVEPPRPDEPHAYVLDLGDGSTATVHPVSVGNPHGVVFVDALERDDFLYRAPRLATHPAFAAGTNVQFARPVGPGTIEAWIWERGAGETLASGSSACAVAAAAVGLGLVSERDVNVRMPGGSVDVAVAEDGSVRLAGPAQIVYLGRVRADVVQAWW